MIIELPEKLYETREQSNIRIEDNTLYLSQKVSFVKTMIQLTYELRGSCCQYCGTKLKKDEITWDHMYPQNFGGPTITNNLVPACFACNAEKSNMTVEEYQAFLKVKREGTEFKIKRYTKKLLEKQEQLKQKGIFNLPEDWVILCDVEDIDDSDNEVAYGKRYQKAADYYEKYGYFQGPIVVDQNGYLLDGYTRLLLAKNNKIKQIPTIVLENVVIVK